eukprot:scaffold541_cov335-Pavlova_lutheri.AAC.18
MAAASSKRHLQVWQGTVRVARRGHQACVRYGIPTPVGGGRGRASNHSRVGPFINGGESEDTRKRTNQTHVNGIHGQGMGAPLRKPTSTSQGSA